MTKPPLHILALEATNVKRLKTVAIVPRSKVVRINGKNDSGKTSTLDAILWALGGKKAVQMQPVREGQERAIVKLAIGGKEVEYIVTRTFTAAGGTHMTVEDAQGGQYKKPQEVLDELFGALSLDPLAFLRSSPADRMAALRDIVKFDVDLEALDRQNKADYDKRTAVNRDIKSLVEKVQLLTASVKPDMDITPVDTAPMFEAMTKASDHNAAIEKERSARRAGQDGISARMQAAQTNRSQAADLLARAEKLEEEATSMRARIDTLPPVPEPIDIAALGETIRGAQEEGTARERQRVARERHEAAVRERDRAQDESEELSARMEGRTQLKSSTIAKAKFPVKGLAFSEQYGVTFGGFPFDQASGAQQLRVSFAVAAAVRPKMPVVLIKDGSLLDEDSMVLLEELAEEYEAQVWIERVGAGPVGIVLEDGEVVAVDGVPVNA